MQWRENVKYLSFSPHWFHANRKLPTWCLRVFVFFICIFFILLEGTVWIWVCWIVFYKCRYVISSHNNHWDHTELYHVSILCSVCVVFNWWWGLKARAVFIFISSCTLLISNTIRSDLLPHLQLSTSESWKEHFWCCCISTLVRVMQPSRHKIQNANQWKLHLQLPSSTPWKVCPLRTNVFYFS